MKKILIGNSLLLALSVICSTYTNAQVPQIDPNAGRRVIVVTDSNFEPQKFKPALSTKPGIAYEVWITTDGVLHCKTASALTTASIEFVSPKITSNLPSGGSTQSGGGYARKVEPKKTNDEYQFSIATDKYREKHAIILSVVSSNGAKSEIKLVNKKVPAEINK